MSMSTPLNTLPLKTQQSNEETSDINDPMVQDVLNEFQEELMISKMHDEKPQHIQPIIYQHPPHQPQINQPAPLYHQQQHQQPNMYSVSHNSKNVQFPYNYIDTELIKKTLIIVIIVILIFNTSILEMIYEKLPPYINEYLYNFDIYVKAISLFIIFYSLGFLQYI